MKEIELLAPAGNLEIGKEAINHGADAVYIGAPYFGARKAAGNSLKDIENLVNHANMYNADVYVTLNTILYNNETLKFQELAQNLYDSGVGAFIVQDMGILEMELPRVRLFASTQVNNYDVDRIKFLEDAGFDRIILARELSLEQIRDIRKQTHVDLEFFVHGALCVSMSGQCYLSHDMGGRSANRGECGQPCRLPWRITNRKGNEFSHIKHPLSLKDLNLSNHLSDMIHAGISSFKIEGRLKNQGYVKNITAYYRQKIDSILAGDDSLKKTSSGTTRFFFKPDPEKTFNRGFSDYFLGGRIKNIVAFDTPKSLGKYLGKVSDIKKDGFYLSSDDIIHNGDGLCFFDTENQLCGIRINKSSDGFCKPSLKQKGDFNKLKKGMKVYRNVDHEFSKLLKTKSAERLILVTFTLKETSHGFALRAMDETGKEAETFIKSEKIKAEKPDIAKNMITNQLKKTGNTCFKAEDIIIKTDDIYFIKKSDLNQMRRDVISKLLNQGPLTTHNRTDRHINKNPIHYKENADYRENISNTYAESFYKKCGLKEIKPAFELSDNVENADLMITKHCLLYSLGMCRKENPGKKDSEPYILTYKKSCYRLEFNCKSCVMKVKRYDSE